MFTFLSSHCRQPFPFCISPFIPSIRLLDSPVELRLWLEFSGPIGLMPRYRGTRCTVLQIDKDGDAEVDCEGLPHHTWIKSANFGKVARLFEAGARVVVQKGLTAIGENKSVDIAKGSYGTIRQVDPEGDAYVHFDAFGDWWVLARENYKIAQVSTNWEGFHLGYRDFHCVACLGFWSTWDPRKEYNLQSLSEILDHCTASCESLHTLSQKDVKCIACTQIWSTYDERQKYNLRSVEEVMSECPTSCAHPTE